MKSYTDIEQSKKLVEILQIESADMYYPYSGIETYPDVKNGLETKTALNCWSLSALLNILPSGYVIVKNYHNLYYVESRDHGKSTKVFNNPIDACYEMILKLHELNLL